MNGIRRIGNQLAANLGSQTTNNPTKKDYLVLIKSIIEKNEYQEYKQKNLTELYFSLIRFTFEPRRIPLEKLEDVQKLLTHPSARNLVKNLKTSTTVNYFKKEETQSIIFPNFFNQELKSNEEGLRIELFTNFSLEELRNIKNCIGDAHLPSLCFEIFKAQNNVVIISLLNGREIAGSHPTEEGYYNNCQLVNQEGVESQIITDKNFIDHSFTQLQNIIRTTIFHLRSREPLEFYYVATLELELSTFGWQYRGTVTSHKDEVKHLYCFEYNNQDVAERVHQVSLAFGLGRYPDAQEGLYLAKSANK